MKTHLLTAQGPACNTKPRMGRARLAGSTNWTKWTKMRVTSHFRLVDCGGCQRTHEYRSRATRRKKAGGRKR